MKCNRAGWTVRLLKSAGTLALLVALAATGAVKVQAQARGPARGSTPAQDTEASINAATSPAELQRLFDAYVLVQAQDVLQLTDAQLPDFMTRLRALQDVRRRAQAERTRIVNDLRRLADEGRNGAPSRERIAERLKSLREIETKALQDAAQAADRLDEVLEPVQQARLRVFEEQMERRKLELLVRARQAVRARRGAAAGR